MLFIVFLVLLLDSTDTTLTANTNCPNGATAFNCNNTFPDAICNLFGQPDPATNQINTGCYDINNCRGYKPF
uniref:Secreted protein n=1 Tax=Acrobeloides nanus TaxID=290746 RepID=A0A914C2P7_9BILA